MDWAGKAGSDNVVILPGVSLSEAQQFIDVLYGKQQQQTIDSDRGH